MPFTSRLRNHATIPLTHRQKSYANDGTVFSETFLDDKPYLLVVRRAKASQQIEVCDCVLSTLQMIA